VQTIYYVFGTKPHLLAAVLDASIAGDVEPVATVDRPWVDALRAERNPNKAVARLVEGSVEIVSRTAPIYEVLRRAAGDAEVSAMLDENRRRRRADQRELIETLSEAGHLRPDIDVDTAGDILYAVLNEEVFQLLVGDCGWTVDRFQTWATELMVQQLRP
jgi:AcrR family transcriptional regulator